MPPVARILSCGTRLHLQHGPIDLVIGADGDRATAFAAAEARFATVLEELVTELPLLKSQLFAKSPRPKGGIAQIMDRATRPHCSAFITPMAAVAGAVADTVLAAMRVATPLQRAYVNNGGDIALHLSPGQSFATAMMDHQGYDLGRIEITHADGIGGIATSGRHGRSLSLGIADSVTVLAASAAQADAAATLIANAVDLPGHPAIHRLAADQLQSDSDLGDQPVVTQCQPLSATEIHTALQAGAHRGLDMMHSGHIIAAALFLQGDSRLIGHTGFTPSIRTQLYA
ncbi:UPF0280 family protein [Parasedimentitalea psychrophila]|uniref:UPF0280 family protein n=1 Tax=Parasedimentitalea psychrophila TaxID=2997337 RepID=A0A9Y2P1R2_9RHOB|nr:UPF0280 family protein [Parasedimentitalea psychrophila]WIY25861.1 UPF0280 family protein [Parasedimentitalea psychrophila]